MVSYCVTNNNINLLQTVHAMTPALLIKHLVSNPHLNYAKLKILSPLNTECF